MLMTIQENQLNLTKGAKRELTKIDKAVKRKKTFSWASEDKSEGHVLKIQADSTHDIFIRRQAFVDSVSVIHHVAAEDKTSKNGVDKIYSATEREEDPNKPSYNKSHKAAKEEGCHPGEVILGLQREKC